MHMRRSFAVLSVLAFAGLLAAPPAEARIGKQARKKIARTLRRAGLAKLPSSSGMLADHAGRKHHALLAGDASGTPPALVAIPGSAIKDLFWRPGVIDAIAGGTATHEQCGEFFAGSQDGTSGGLGACHMAESTGYSFGDILQSENSLCYMKRFPTPANVTAGAVTVVSGDLPDGDITKLFSVPAGTASRVVQVQISGQSGGDGPKHIFLRVPGAATNQAAGNLYAVDIWYCSPTDPNAAATGFDHITLANSGLFQDVMEEGHGPTDTNISTVTGYVTFAGGVVAWDTSRARGAVVEESHSGGSFKGAVDIEPDNEILTKSYDVFGGNGQKGYAVTRFSGTGPDTVSFLDGAFKEQGGGNVTGSAEFRNTYYAAAPASSLLSALDAVDLGTDPFYDAPASSTIDTSAYSCATTPDVAVALDFTNPAAQIVQAACENAAFRNMHFCHDDPAISAAEMNYFTVCNH